MSWDLEDLLRVKDPRMRADAVRQLDEQNERAAARGAPTLDLTLVKKSVKPTKPTPEPPVALVIDGEPDTVTIVIRGQVPLNNALLRHQPAYRGTKTRDWTIAVAIALATRDHAEVELPCDLVVHHFYAERRAAGATGVLPDSDAVALTAKAARDGMTPAGFRLAAQGSGLDTLPGRPLLPDDSPKYLWNTTYTDPIRWAYDALVLVVQPAKQYPIPNIPEVT